MILVCWMFDNPDSMKFTVINVNSDGRFDGSAMIVGMVVEDCLLLLLNLLRHNVSNQNFLKEGSYIQRLPACLDFERRDQPDSDMWSAQKVTNVHLMLEVYSSHCFMLDTNALCWVT